MNNNTELILIRITGLDRPGLTASITEILSKYDVTILDIGQADIHSTLSLGILFKSQEKDSGNIMKELLFKASALGINIRFYPVTVEEYEEWVNMQGKNRYILTLLGRKLTAKQIAAVTGILAEQGLNIDAIKRLTGRIPLDERKANVRACIEFSVRGTPRQREEMQQALMKLSSDLEMDFSFQLDNMYRRMRRLICFDMDSTLIQTECIDELAERAGVGDQVREITERAMRGEIDFIESFTERVALLKGLDESVMKEIAAVTGILAEQGLNIDAIKRLTGRIPLDERKANVRACIEFSVRGTPRQREEMQQALMKLSSDLEMDFSFQLDNMYRRMRRLICFDMDSTLIQTECIDELAERAGVGDQVREITERAMRGEIDFIESFTERVALLKGLDESVMKEIAENLPITEGVERLMFVLKRYGYKIAILSGGFTYFGNYLKDKFGIDYVYANELEIVNGKLTGRYLGDVVDGKRKAELLKLIAQVERVDIAQTIAVGDGANDLPMLSEAGLGIAFHAKPKVVANAQQSINTIGLDGVLYFLGFKDSYLEERGKL